jgi:hypothetical protein
MAILLISAFQGARITGVSHWHLAQRSLKVKNKGRKRGQKELNVATELQCCWL